MAQIIISELPPLPDGTGSGTPKGTDLTPATDTTDTTEAATGTTKKYTRAAEFNYYMTAQGFITKTACRVATTLALTVTYANGALGVGATLTNAGAQAAISIDSVTLALGDRVLIKNQVSQFQNGIYTVTTLGSGATNWVLTRATDYDQAADISQHDLVLVNQGTTNANIAFQQTGGGPFTLGTTAIIFAAFSSVSAGFVWNTVTATSQTMSANNGYVANNGALVTLTLPTTASLNSEIAIVGQGAGGWLVAQNAGQNIQIGSSTTSVGVGGSVASTNRYDALRLICITANTAWTLESAPQSAGLTIV